MNTKTVEIEKWRPIMCHLGQWYIQWVLSWDLNWRGVHIVCRENLPQMIIKLLSWACGLEGGIRTGFWWSLDRKSIDIWLEIQFTFDWESWTWHGSSGSWSWVFKETESSSLELRSVREEMSGSLVWELKETMYTDNTLCGSVRLPWARYSRYLIY